MTYRQHVAQQDRRHREHHQRLERLDRAGSERPLSAEAAAAWDAMVEKARLIEAQRSQGGSAFGPAKLLRK